MLVSLLVLSVRVVLGQERGRINVILNTEGLSWNPSLVIRLGEKTVHCNLPTTFIARCINSMVPTEVGACGATFS